MSTVVGKSHFTPEDVLRLSGDERFELVDGQLVGCDMGFELGWVTSLLAGLISAHALRTQRENFLIWHYKRPGQGAV